MSSQTVLITGAARRVGAQIARTLHGAGYRIALHYRNSKEQAHALADGLNAIRPDSVRLLPADLSRLDEIKALAESAAGLWGGLDALVNNASSFYPTPLGTVTETQWDDLLASNLKAGFFLSQAAAPYLRERSGAIVNIVDIHGERGLKDYPVYSIAKAGLAAMTRSFAKELAPTVRVNGVAPGAILWPEQHSDAGKQSEIIGRIPLGRTGSPEDVARAVLFLLRDSPYVTGQLLAVDGGRSLFG
jgi:pteridine reductase